MTFTKTSALAMLAFIAKVQAHGHVQGIVADGVYYEGYNANFQYFGAGEEPIVAAWYTPEDQSNGFISPDAYATSDIICHTGAANGQTYADVTAGGIVEMQWTAWPSSHHGPVIDYLADCGGDCTTVDKTTLEWFKIDGTGLVSDTTVPGTWATDTLIANNNSWAVTIPSDIASGNYVLRHEIIALHSAGTADGAQNYPQCVNLKVSGSGTATPSGVLGTALYSETDAGIIVNIYSSLSTYDIPGPTLYSGAITMSQTQQPSATSFEAVSVGATTPGATAAAATATSASAASAEAVVASSSGAQITFSASSSASAAAITPSASLSSALYTNGTATASKSKSACKSKSKSASKSETASATLATVTSAASDTTSVGVARAAVSTTSSAPSPIATTSSAAVASSSSTSSTSSSSTKSLPTGTTLADLLSWVSSFWTAHANSDFDESTLARRHARDLEIAGYGKN